jgi:hypothetical protein
MNGHPGLVQWATESSASPSQSMAKSSIGFMVVKPGNNDEISMLMKGSSTSAENEISKINNDTNSEARSRCMTTQSDLK